MKEPDKNLKSLIETITKSKLPNWAKTTSVLSVVFTPFLDSLTPLIIALLIISLVKQLLGL